MDSVGHHRWENHGGGDAGDGGGDGSEGAQKASSPLQLFSNIDEDGCDCDDVSASALPPEIVLINMPLYVAWKFRPSAPTVEFSSDKAGSTFKPMTFPVPTEFW